MMLLLLSLVTLSSQQHWAPENYPNPRKAGFGQCKMRSSSNICDPEEVLTESERYRLNHELGQLALRTERKGGSYCSRKGMDAVLAIARQGSQQLANGLRNLWHMDDQCKTSAVFLFSAEKNKLYYAPQPNTILQEAELRSIVAANSVHMQQGNFVPALVHIFQEIGRSASDDVGRVIQQDKADSPVDDSAQPEDLVLDILGLVKGIGMKPNNRADGVISRSSVSTADDLPSGSADTLNELHLRKDEEDTETGLIWWSSAPDFTPSITTMIALLFLL